MKKLNEAQFRSPKWLRKYLDFEVTTGKDVSPEAKAKRKQIEDEEFRKEQEEKERIKKFNNDWKKIISDDYMRPYFTSFLKTKGIEVSGDVREVIMNKKYYNIFDEFYSWFKRGKDREEEERLRKVRKEQAEKEAERKRKQAQSDIERELDDLINRVINDFNTYRFSDKYMVKDGTFIYTFEKGDKFTVGNDGKLSYNGFTYTLGLLAKTRFINLANNIINAKGQRNRDQKGQNQNNQGGQRQASSTYKETPKTGDPKRDKYNLLKDKIRQREDQLSKMSKTHPNRSGLENELQAYKRVRDKMKSDYKFEHLNSFNHYLKNPVQS